MVADMLALDVAPSTFVGFLSRHSEGNPFFVAEYLRTAIAEGVLFRDLNGRWMVRADDETATEQTYEELPLPKALLDVVRRRLEALPAHASQLTEAAAVFGREVDSGALAQASGFQEDELQELIGILMRREVLEESGETGLRFVHDKIREVAYDGIAPTRRRELHAAAATAVETRFGTERYEHLVALSRHWELAGREVQAARYRAEAGQQAVASYTAREGLAELDRAIPCCPARSQLQKTAPVS
jgi:predicted ATPase